MATSNIVLPTDLPLKATVVKSNRHRTQDDAISVLDRVPTHRPIEFSFQRTIRVADDSQSSFQPPALGTLPLFSVDDYKDRLPAHMVQKGGFFTSMYQREALWMKFSSDYPFAVRIYVDGVNAISGEPELETEYTKIRQAELLAQQKCIQDYVVTPNGSYSNPQEWLPGFIAPDGHVHQFVAPRLGSGYSSETQLTGEGLLGALQIEVIPKRWTSSQVEAKICGLNKDPSEMSSMCEAEWQRVKGLYAPDIKEEILVKTLTGKTITLHCSLWDTVDYLMQALEDQIGVPFDWIRLVFQGSTIEGSKCLGCYGIRKGSLLHLILRLCSNGGPTKKSEMGVAYDALRKQTAMRDHWPAGYWDVARAMNINVQILNSVIFEKVTGEPAPPTPITAETYAEHKQPYLAVYDEKPYDAFLGGDGKRRQFKPVVELEKELRGLKS